MADASTVADAAGPPKTAKQLEKEKQKLAKLEKFKQKQEKKSAVGAGEVKEKTEVCWLIFIWLIVEFEGFRADSLGDRHMALR